MKKSFPLIKAGCYLGSRWLVNNITGKDRIPAGGGTIIAPNHSSVIDGIILNAYLNWKGIKPTHPIVQKESFDNKFFGYILRSGRSIPLDRTCRESVAEMFKQALAYLDRGEDIVIFPEGHLNNGTSMRLPRPGAALLALESGAPILPVGLSGTRAIYTVGEKFNYKKRAQIHFGKLIDTSALSMMYHEVDSDERAKLTKELSSRMMKQIAELSGLKVHRRME